MTISFKRFRQRKTRRWTAVVRVLALVLALAAVLTVRFRERCGGHDMFRRRRSFLCHVFPPGFWSSGGGLILLVALMCGSPGLKARSA